MQVTKLQSQRKSLSTPEEPYALDILLITIQVHTRVHSHAHTHTHTQVYSHTHKYTHVLFHTHIRTRSLSLKRTQTHSLTHSYTHTHTPKDTSVLSLCLCPGHPVVPEAEPAQTGPWPVRGLPEAEQLRGPDPGAGAPEDALHAVPRPRQGQRQRVQVPSMPLTCFTHSVSHTTFTQRG